MLWGGMAGRIAIGMRAVAGSAFLHRIGTGPCFLSAELKFDLSQYYPRGKASLYLDVSTSSREKLVQTSRTM